MYKSFWGRLTAPRSNNEVEARSEYATNAVLVIAGGIALATTIPIVIVWGFIKFDALTLGVMLNLDILILGGYLFSRMGHWRIASNLVPALFFLLGVYFSLTVGLVTTGLLFYLVAILMTGFLQTRAVHWLMVVLSVATHLTISEAFHSDPPEDLIAIGLMMAATFASLTSMQRFFIAQIHASIDRARRSEQQTRRQLEELQVLHAIASAGTEAGSEEELIESFTNILGESFYLDHFGVLLLDEAKQSLYPHPSYRGIEPEAQQLRLNLDQGVVGRVAGSGKPVVVRNVDDAPEFLEVTPGVRSEICVPLHVNGRVIGVVNAESRQQDAFTPDDERLLVTASAQLAIAIEKMRLHHKMRQRLEHLVALHKVDQAITAHIDLRPVLELLLKELLGQTKVDAAAIRLYSPIDHTLRMFAMIGLPAAAAQTPPVHLGKGHAGRAVLTRKAVRVDDLREAGAGFTPDEMIGVEEFTAYAAVPLIAKGQVNGVLEILNRSPFSAESELHVFLDTFAAQAAIAIDNTALFLGFKKANSELIDAYDSTIEGWSRALDLRDKETEGHSQRVTELTLLLAKAMGMSEEQLVHVRRGALLHDIGKMGVPDHILWKAGPLTDEEWGIMRRHTVYAKELLSHISYLRPALDIPYLHHERWDGSGYPLGLKGEQIPLAARIFALVDVWDALRSDRPYRPAWTNAEALAYIRAGAGTLFDPEVVACFLEKIVGEPAEEEQIPSTSEKVLPVSPGQ
jgi:HD-GYP domain-containing protein (c-di-GMP phosphodiesterase class II)